MSAAASVPFLLFSTFHSHRIKLTSHWSSKSSIVSVLTSFDFHTFFSIMKAPLAFPILDVTVPPCLVMVLPRLRKDSTSLIGFPPTVIGVFAVVFILINSVFLRLILRLVLAENVSKRRVLSCIWFWLWASRSKSPAKSKSSSCSKSVHWMPIFFPLFVSLMIQSMTKRKRKGDSKHPCQTPVFTWNFSDVWPACTTLQPMSW